jgi:hypothetical protein
VKEEGKGEEIEEEMSIGGGRGRKRNIAKEMSRGGEGMKKEKKIEFFYWRNFV